MKKSILLLFSIFSLHAYAQVEIVSTGDDVENVYYVNFPGVYAYTNGISITFKANFTNIIFAPRVNVNNLGEVPIRKVSDNYDLNEGDIKINQVVTLVYDGSVFQITSNLGNLGNPDAWLNGGNYINGDGILGTMSDNALSIYTNGMEHIRLNQADRSTMFRGNIYQTGIYGVSIGRDALANGYNPFDSYGGVTAIGRRALASYIGNYGPSVAIGDEALSQATQGVANIALGNYSLRSLTTGNSNIGLGFNSGYAISTGSDNILIGSGGNNLSTGSGNIILGRGSENLQSGSHNISLGDAATVATVALNNTVALGRNAFVTSSNSIVLGATNGVNSSDFSHNVGIGTTAPQARLHIDGTGASFRYRVNGVNPTAGHVLTTDANGNATWQAAGGGGGGGSDSQTLSIAGNNLSISNGNTVTLPSGSGGWGFTGNSVSNSDFLGTTNSESLKFRINNANAGFIGLDDGNTALGQGTLAVSGTGQFNTSMGYFALSNTGTGSNNTAVGASALRSNTTGVQNVAIGSSALISNVLGGSNVAVGSMSLINNINAGANTALGTYSLFANTNGQDNTAVGYSANLSNVSGSSNTALGAYAGSMSSAIDLFNATAIGSRAQVNTSNSMVLGSVAGVNGAISSVNVGIGVNAPEARLDVNGSFRLVNGTQGSGKILKSDANGFATWQDCDCSGSGGSGSTSNAWELGGNAVTDNDFIGTTNPGKSLKFKAGNDLRLALTPNGVLEVFANSIGIGSASMQDYNGMQDIAIGHNSMFFAVDVSNNIALGHSALTYSSNAGNNIGIGTFSLGNTTGGYYNIALGDEAMNNSSNSSNNIAIGQHSLINSLNGSDNIGIGVNAMQNINGGIGNIGLGRSALNVISGGLYNIAMGEDALLSNQQGNYNIGLGYSALRNLTLGGNNIGIGPNTGQNTQFGMDNIFIGNSSGSIDDYSNTIAIGIGATANGDNEAVLGNFFTTSIGGAVDWTSFSDGRFKSNVKANVPGLDFINLLKPVTYHLDVDKIDAVLHASDAKHNDTRSKLKSNGGSVIYSGFLAQEVETAAKSIDYVFSGVDAPQHDKDVYGLRYGQFVVPLVKAVQELSAKVDAQQKMLEKQQALITLLLEQTEHKPNNLVVEKSK